MKYIFIDFLKIWEHISNGECPGKPVGLRTRFENGLTGFVPIDKISDSRVNDPNERVKVSVHYCSFNMFLQNTLFIIKYIKHMFHINILTSNDFEFKKELLLIC